MRNVHNFASGPACLPEEVLQQIRDDMLEWNGSGMSVLEMPSSCAEYHAIAVAAERDLRALLDVPATHRILFLQGGAYAHFAVVAMNLLPPGGSADYVVTGLWSQRALSEAQRYGKVNIVASGASSEFRRIPPQEHWCLDPDAAYCHITTNETAHGTQFHWLPQLGDVPLVADVTSDFLTRPIDVSRFGLLYASAQKNAGCTGLSIVVVREDLLKRVSAGTPQVFDYSQQVACDGRINTPPTFSVYVAGLMFAWMLRQGGLAAFGRAIFRHSSRLYDLIDASALYRCPVEPLHRSRVNICFRLRTPALEKEFLAQARDIGLRHLEGHPAVGGVRVSLHNATPQASVEALLDFMRAFALRHQAVA